MCLFKVIQFEDTKIIAAKYTNIMITIVHFTFSRRWDFTSHRNLVTF